MNLLSTLMPTHTMLATAAAAASVPSVPSVPSGLRVSASPREDHPPVRDPIRKYVILRDPVTGDEHPIIFSRQIQHSTMVPPGMRPVSAGFILIWNGRVQIPESFDSESLHLGPRPQDKDIITNFLS